MHGMKWMRIFSFLIVLLLLAAHAKAQQNLLIDEQFNDNSRGWQLRSTEVDWCKIDSGRYTLARNAAQGYSLFTLNQYLDPKRDFTLEAELTQLAGHDNSSLGLTWGGRGYGFFHYFAITSTGYWKVGYVWKDKGKNIQDWVKGPVHKMGRANVLKVAKRGNTMHYYINGREVYQSEFDTYYGTEIGFQLDQEKKVRVEYLKLNHVPVEINLPDSTDEHFAKVPLTATINTANDELAPVISADGNTLYFCRSDDPQNIGYQGYFDIWYCQRQQNGKWGDPIHMDRPLNNESSNWVISVTPDGNTLLLSGTYDAEGKYAGAGISISKRTKNGWSVPKEVVIEQFYTWGRYASYFLSNDQQVLVMAVEREDGYGDQDLYVSYLREDGTFSRPKNLGKTVNTFSAESAPFLAADMRTLYFGSMGRPGYGSADIYVTKRLDESWTKWTEPINLGPDINDAQWNNYYTVPASGEVAYMVQSDLATYNEDIVQVELADALKPDPVVLIRGRVLNSKDSLPLEAEITWADLDAGLKLGFAHSNPTDGSYAITLPFGLNYGFYARREGFYSISENMLLKDSTQYAEIEKDLYLTPIEVGQAIRLNNIFFEFDKAELLPTSSDELNRLIDFLNEHPTMVIEIGGHTDSKGSDSYNASLSERRANTVMQYLTQHGVAPERLTAKGYGESTPIMPNTSEEGRAYNRRVEFIVLKK